MTLIALWRNVIAASACLATVAVAAPGSRAWQQTPSTKDLATVIDMLRSPDPVVRVSVACSREVFNESAAAAIPALIDLLDDAEPVSPEVCRDDHRRWWGDEQPITAGQESARALVRIGIASFDPLTKALASAGPTARRNAAWALGALDDQRAVTPLIASLARRRPTRPGASLVGAGSAGRCACRETADRNAPRHIVSRPPPGRLGPRRDR